MNYTEINITFLSNINEEQKGIYISDLGDLGCESFVEERQQLMAYISETDYMANSEDIISYVSNIPNTKYSVKNIEAQNWNAVWESNFDPIEVNAQCGIRAPFHQPLNKELEVIIMPRMAFGTGHHQTTRLMIETMLMLDIESKEGLDMGCGTGVLAIVALLRGAHHMDAIDIDEWAYDNVIENAENNSVKDKISAYWGDATLLGNDGALSQKQYDFILANINRNILIRDMEHYVSHLKKGGYILFSGFLEDDIDLMANRASELGLTPTYRANKDKWYMLTFIKE